MKRFMPILIGVIVALCLCGVLSIALSPGSSTPASAPAQPAATLAPAPTAIGQISKETLGAPWPLSIESGVMQCTDQRHVLFIADGATYAVNGTARGAIKAGAPYKDVEEIWLDNPDMAGAKISLQPLLDIGLALCK